MPHRPGLSATGVALALLGMLAACSTERVSEPARTATEQLLISTAADRAAKRLALDIPQNAKVYVDPTNFEATDGKYALSAIRAQLLERGAFLVADRKDADIVVEPRSGALSIDETTAIVGIPQFDIPVPAAGNFAFPEIALFKKEEKEGVAKFAAFGYSAKTGEIVASSESDYGFSHKTHWVVALFISWNSSDLIPENSTSKSDRYFFGTQFPFEPAAPASNHQK